MRTIRARRREALDRAAPSGLAAGRLLAYDPNQNLFDGAASQASLGFFDDDNVPPWDTWVDYVRESATGSDHFAEYLVSWVPPEFLSLAAAGIDANPEQCIAWLTDVPRLRPGRSRTAESIIGACLAPGET